MPTRTILVAGNGTGTLAFQLDGPDITDVEAVLAEIDTNSAGDTVATLTATSPAGNDVAAVPQGQPVSGGGQGRATWALRLAEDAAGGALVTEDGVTVIDPTDTIFVGPGLVLTNLGGGVAEINSRPATAPSYAHIQLGGGPYTPGDEIPFFNVEAAGITVGSSSFTFQTGGLYLISCLINATRDGALDVGAFMSGEIRFGTPAVTPGGLAESLFWWPDAAPVGSFWGTAHAFTGLYRVHPGIGPLYPDTTTPNYACVLIDSAFAAALQIENGLVSVLKVGA